MWSYDNEYRNNNNDKSQSNPGDEDGKDAYGFVMLDGAPGLLDNDFPDSHTTTTRSIEQLKIKKRSMLTTNATVLDSTFEHAEQTVYVYCNFPQQSKECQKVWYKGVEDTIIRLPAHIGEGPYARVVSFETAEPQYQLPYHHVAARSLEGNTSPVYKMKFGYDFHLIKRDDVVNMRVDFTNLLGFWDDVTDEPASKRKRDAYADHLSQPEWRSKIGKAKRRHAELRKRKIVGSHGTTTTDMGDESRLLKKRWFGKFFDWLGRLNTVENKEVGYLSVAIKKTLLLFSASQGCPGQTFSANMKLYLDADVEMEATYAYYFSGTIVPPAVTGTYAFFSLEASAYLGLRMEGNARFQAGTGRKKLLDTISYPGLAIKGIAAVGPTLDLYGEIRGIVTLKGEMKASAKLNFGKAEVYWPQDDAASDKYQTLLGVNSDPSAQSKDLIAPTFDAKVKIDAAIDILVTPEANLGLRIGGKISGGSPLVDAQIVGYVNNTLRFHASAKGTVGTNQGTTATYSYGVYLLYNIGYGAYATIKFFPNWALKPRNAFNPSKQFTIYENSGSFLGNTKRTIDAPLQLPRRGLAEDWSGTELSAPNLVHSTHGHSHRRHVGHYKRHHPVHRGEVDLSLNSSSAMSMQSLLGKRADNNAPSSSQAVNIAPLQCPPGATGQVRNPDYRLNCVLFQTAQLNGNGQTAPVTSICPGVQGFYRGRGLANSDLTLTWDKDVARANKRRDAACGRQYCGVQQSRLRTLIGDKTISISCDEFPFASAEEGGSYVSTLQNQPGTPSLTCVPAWQNTLQGNCNKLLLNGIATNVGYFERQQRGDTADSWADWDGSAWLSAGNLGSGPAQVTQRVARYPDQVAQGSGIDTNTYNQANGALGWMYRRNFTFGLAELQSSTDGNAWTAGNNPAQSWTLRETGQFPPGTDGHDLSSIACAVNIFGQDTIFR
ncbi:hypothetical protein XPA_005788 [Xanthoria parietina]